MQIITRFGLAALLGTAIAGTVAAQASENGSGKSNGTAAAARTDTTTQKATKVSLYRPLEIAHIRPADKRGVNVFEAPKDDVVPFTGFAHVDTTLVGGADVRDLERPIQTHLRCLLRRRVGRGC